MRASGVARLAVAGAVAGGTACSIWAAISDPYKSDRVDAATGVPSGDARTDAGARGASGRPIVDSGISPYAIAAYGDSVYIVGSNGQVEVARGASASFATFWTADGGEFFYPRTNGVSVSDAGVFWTVSTGIHYCAPDGGACGFLPSANYPRAIAASDTVVAWIDDGGVEECAVPLRSCNRTTLAGSRGATSLTAGPRTIAWSDSRSTIHIDRSAFDLAPHDVAVIGFDRASSDLYWGGRFEVGAILADGAPDRIYSLGDQGNRPDELFSANGVVYWSIATLSTVFYCQTAADGGCTVNTGTLNSGVAGANTNDGIVATSRNVLAIIGSTNNMPAEPELAAWPLPH
jgi:hypothetical protein